LVWLYYLRFFVRARARTARHPLLLRALARPGRARAYLGGGFPPEFGADAAARRRSGVALGQQGDYVASALAYRAALLLEPEDADALNNLGWTMGKLGYLAQAVPPLEKALAIRPDFTLARNNLAWVKSQLK